MSAAMHRTIHETSPLPDAPDRPGGQSAARAAPNTLYDDAQHPEARHHPQGTNQRMHQRRKRLLSGPVALAALAGVVSAAVVLAVAELLGAFFTARATPLIALGSTFIDFTPPWMKDFAIATFGTNDKAALFAGMGLTILLLACVLGVVAYRRWALGVAGVVLMGTVIVASVVTRASVKPLDAIPSLIGTVAGLIVLRLLITRLWRMREWPEVASDRGAKEPERPATSRRAFFTATGITAVAAAAAATGDGS